MSIDPAPPRPRPLHRLAWAVFVLGLCAAATPLLARWLWPAELLCHFRQPLGITLGALAGAGFLARVHRPAAAIAILSLYSVWPLLLLHLPGDETPARGDTLRVLSTNVLWGTDVEPRLMPWIEAEDPDVIVLLELDRPHLEMVQRLAERGYTHQLFCPEPQDYDARTWGRALVSKLPLRDAQLTLPGPIMDVVVDFEGRPLRILGTHTMRPGRPDRNDPRDATLAKLAELAAEQPGVVILGDLNLTEFTPRWGDLIEDGHLLDTRAGRGHMGSWKVHMPRLGWALPFPRLALDHVLIGEDLVCTDRRLGPDVGSDHLPIVADVGWR